MDKKRKNRASARKRAIQLAVGLFAASAALLSVRALGSAPAAVAGLPEGRAELEIISRKDPGEVDRAIEENRRREEIERQKREADRAREERLAQEAREREELEKKLEEQRLAREAEEERKRQEQLRILAERKDEVSRRAAEELEREGTLSREELDRIAFIQDSSVNPWRFFKDTVVMGDSRAVGFWYYHYLDRSRVLADGGHNIRRILPQLDALKALSPKTVILCYGLNDTGVGFWKTPEAYATEYMQIIDRIRAELPDTRIVVSSILPASQAAINDRAPSWAKIPAFSAEVGARCADHGAVYADNTAAVGLHFDLWDPDGVHVKKAFYPYWARSILSSYTDIGELR